MNHFVQTVVNLLQSRFELFEAECKQERSRLAALFTLLGISCVAILIGGGALLTAVVIAVPESYRVLTLSIAGILALIAAALCARSAAQLLKQSKTPFAATREELRKDVECISSVITNKK
jgi:uncharacterized membrane protein YqjE